MIDMRTFAEWFALYQVDPWGEKRDDLRMAMLAYQVCCSQMTKEGAAKMKFKDFLYTPPIDVIEKTPEEREAAATMWAKALNAKAKK